MRYVVIMAGGSGKRLWPLSRQGEPKQLLPLFEGRSLLQLAWDRVSRVVAPEQVLVCTGADYADVVRRQLPELAPENLLGEPEGRDSLNAAAWPAAVLAARDPDAVVAMVTADQLISPVEVFTEALTNGFRLAEDRPDVLVTFGVVPTSPHTGYGYLARGQDIAGYGRASAVDEFREKPDAATAQEYLASGRYWWNSGMFVWRARTFLDQLAVLLPGTYAKVLELAARPELLPEIYPTLLKISVDYAVMEPVSRGEGSARVAAIALDITWADVGSFASLWDVLDHDADCNARMGTTVVRESSGNLLVNATDDSVLAVLGLDDVVVVRTEFATLVAPLSASQQIKTLVEQVADEAGAELA
ncbi:mannose-1-phosphate guanylyltransferase [Brooklawnia cerclae]|uniref:Mannose-1-phosphate guanylyltransferase n=1 Tax=Brooklawnia cerclae TaxID=349934 RepID=A0ABX0SH96_9ACTN|nr:mannose-1-phosphate guanylyltransferase [Brooklawnia cerclae]